MVGAANASVVPRLTRIEAKAREMCEPAPAPRGIVADPVPLQNQNSNHFVDSEALPMAERNKPGLPPGRGRIDCSPERRRVFVQSRCILLL
jgi:hypothetical protein